MLTAMALGRPQVGAVKEHSSLQMPQVWGLVVGLGEKHLSLNKVGLVVHGAPSGVAGRLFRSRLQAE